jgi:hypothetical protein
VAPLPVFHAFHVLAALLTLAGSPHAAPSSEEQRLFADGLKAFDAGDARAAERAWKEGYAVAHDPAFLVRIGEAQEKAGAPAEAAESYRRYLREAPDAADRADIEQRLTRLAPAPAPRNLADTADTGGEFGAHPPPGLPQGPAPRTATSASRPATDADAARAAMEDEDSGWNRYNITAWVATAATAALLGTAAFFGASASSKESDVNRLLTFRDQATGAPLEYSPMVAQQYESATADGRRYARDARWALLGAAGTAVVAAVFFVIDETHPAKAAVAVSPASHGAGALGALSWSF